MSRVISSAPSLVSRASTSCSSMWIEVRTSSLTRRSRDDDRVLVVVSLPRHVRHEQVLPQGDLARVGGRAVGDDLTLRDLVPDVDDRLLVEVGPLVGPSELDQFVGAELPGLLLHDDDLGRDVFDRARLVGEHDVTRVDGGAELDAGPDERSLGPEQRDRLALHVGAHQGTVGVVVLEERDQGRRHGDELLRARRPCSRSRRAGPDRPHLPCGAPGPGVSWNVPSEARRAFACAMTCLSSSSADR